MLFTWRESERNAKHLSSSRGPTYSQPQPITISLDLRYWTPAGKQTLMAVEFNGVSQLLLCFDDQTFAEMGRVKKVLQMYAKWRMGRGWRKENKVHAFISTLLKQIRIEQKCKKHYSENKLQLVQSRYKAKELGFRSLESVSTQLLNPWEKLLLSAKVNNREYSEWKWGYVWARGFHSWVVHVFCWTGVTRGHIKCRGVSPTEKGTDQGEDGMCWDAIGRKGCLCLPRPWRVARGKGYEVGVRPGRWRGPGVEIQPQCPPLLPRLRAAHPLLRQSALQGTYNQEDSCV